MTNFIQILVLLLEIGNYTMFQNWRTTPKSMRWATLFNAIDRRGTRLNILVLLCVMAAALFVFYELNQHWRETIPSPIDEVHPVQMLDLYSAYEAGHAWQILEALGPENRQLYLVLLLTLDVVFPVTYTILLIWLFIFLLRNSYPKLFNALYRLTIVIPLLLFMADLLENMSIVVNITIFPQQSNVFLHIADFFTESKWILLNFILLWIFIGIIARWMNRKEVLDYQAEQEKIRRQLERKKN